MEDALAKIQELVNQCLGFLGSNDIWSNIQSVLMQIVATLILFLVVKFFLWNKITRLIEARQEIVQNNIKETKEERIRARKLAESRDIEYQAAKKEARMILEEAVKTANKTRDQIIEEAKIEAKRRLDNADEEIQSEIEKSKQEIKNAIVDVAFLAAEKMVKREINKDEHRDIVQEFIEEVGR